MCSPVHSRCVKLLGACHSLCNIIQPLLPSIAYHVSVQCAANCQHCVKPGKCDPGGCSLGYGLTSSGTCAKVWGRFVGVVCAQRFTLDVSNCCVLTIHFATSSCLCCTRLPTPFSVQCAASCHGCRDAGASKCDPGGCYGGYELTSKRTCAKVWGRFVGVVCAHRFTLDVSNCWGLAISFGTSSCLCCNQLPTMFACSVQQTVGIAQQLEPASAIGVLMAMAPPQNAHAQRCGVDLWVLCVLTGSFSLCQTVGGLPFPLQHHPTFVALNCLPCFRAVCGKLSALRQTRQVRSWWLFSWLWAHLEWHMRKGVG